MSVAKDLLERYLDGVRDPKVASALFADDGVIELPSVAVRAQGPAGIEKMLTELLAMVPDFRFQDIRFWIVTPDRVFAEYSVDATIASTGARYRQTYSGLLIAEDGKIGLLREALDSLAAAKAFAPAGNEL